MLSLTYSTIASISYSSSASSSGSACAPHPSLDRTNQCLAHLHHLCRQCALRQRHSSCQLHSTDPPPAAPAMDRSTSWNLAKSSRWRSRQGERGDARDGEAMRAMRCEQGEAMLRCEAMRGEGKRGDASDARRSTFGVLRRGEGLRGDACEAMRAVRGEAMRPCVLLYV